MIEKLTTEQTKKHSYRVQRPFVYMGTQYEKGQAIRATDKDLKFLLRNNLIA